MLLTCSISKGIADSLPPSGGIALIHGHPKIFFHRQSMRKIHIVILAPQEIRSLTRNKSQLPVRAPQPA